MKAAFVFVAVLFAVTFQAQAQSAPDGVFVGSEEDEDGDYDATVQLRIRQPTNEILPTYPFTGTIVFTGPSVSGGLQGRMRGDVLNGSDTGEFRFSFVGTVRTGTYNLQYDSTVDRISLGLIAPRVGRWMGDRRIVLHRRVSARELTGGWAFPDGNVMTITKSGNRYLGSYRGTAASGHPDLVGSLSGRLRNETWKGAFHVQENNVQFSNVFVFRYLNESPPALRGTIGRDSYTLVKQEVGLPFP